MIASERYAFLLEDAVARRFLERQLEVALANALLLLHVGRRFGLI